MTWKEKLTQTRIAKCVWWCVTALALFFGALGLFVVIAAWEVGAMEPGVRVFWDAPNFSYYAYSDCDDIMQRMAQMGWQPTDAQHLGTQENQFIRYHIYQVNRDGEEVETIYKDAEVGNEANTEVYRIFRRSIEVQEDGSYAIISEEDRHRNYSNWRPNVSVMVPSYAESVQEPMQINMDLYVNTANVIELVENPTAVQTWAEENMLLNAGRFMYLKPRATDMLIVAIVCAIAGLTAMIALGLGAGRTANSHVAKLCAYDRVPMELQGALLLLLLYVCGWWLNEITYYIGFTVVFLNRQDILLGFTGLCAATALFAIVAFYSFVRWAKVGHPLSCFWTVRILSKVWQGSKVVLKTVFFAMPAIWRWLLLFAVLAGLHLINIMFPYNLHVLVQLILWFVLWAVMVIAASHAALSVQDIQRQVKAFLAGDYQATPKFHTYLPATKEISEGMCRIGDGMNAAVEQRIKSERMKTELITNVSHDLKTPLTSIINYTDLLAKEDLPESAQEYAQIIAQQGERLRKLTEDLVEASKAASGVLSCTKVPTDLKELCQQAVAEYTDRLEAADLNPVLTLPEENFAANLDGRLTWRILDNLFSNACKYAQPGTRVYLVGEQGEGYVTLTMKNISRDQLNIPAEELMERFVRGDSARSGEGSGLGLSIARSLSELQGGQFSLYVNGDLFQAQVRFPKE